MPLTRKEKGGADFATSVDVESEQAMAAVLSAAKLGHGILAEEAGWVEGGPDSPSMWLIDPLCGTVNFAMGVPLFSVNVSLQEHGQTAVGVMMNPLTDEAFWAIRGDGAYVISPSGKTEHLTSGRSSGLLAVDGGGGADEPSKVLWDIALRLEASRAFRVRVMGTTLFYAYIARGSLAGGVFKVLPQLEWAVHHAPGLLLCEEAGCVVTDLDGTPRTPESGYALIGADRKTHGEMLRLIAT